MATTFKEGDRVQIVDREATADDIKSGLFYNHFRGLTGMVQKVYDSQEAAIEIEMESLEDPLSERHTDVQEQMKSKWLDGLSEEGRNRLTDQEKDFRLRYTVLVGVKDLIAPTKKAVAPKPAQAIAETAAPKPARAVAQEETPRRATSEDLSAAEEEYLRQRRENE
jgi:ribosomal protein L21E